MHLPAFTWTSYRGLEQLLNLLLCSHVFEPSIGGIETVSKLLAESFSSLGVNVVVCTKTPGGSIDKASYQVRRTSNLIELLKLGRASDVILQNNISLQTLLPLLLLRKPIVIVHHTWIRGRNGQLRLRDRAKLWFASFFKNVCVSQALRDALPFPCEVVSNPVELSRFDSDPDGVRSGDIVFVGRLVSDKGCDLLLRALAELRSKGRQYSATIIGDGPERTKLERLSAELDLKDYVSFLGRVVEDRGKIIATHKVIAIPSRWAEPFGIVAIEALAAGCIPVAARTGGLPEAVASFGPLVVPNDASSLAEGLEAALCGRTLYMRNTSALKIHLNSFAPNRVAGEYLRIFRSLLCP